MHSIRDIKLTITKRVQAFSVSFTGTGAQFIDEQQLRALGGSEVSGKNLTYSFTSDKLNSFLEWVLQQTPRHEHEVIHQALNRYRTQGSTDFTIYRSQPTVSNLNKTNADITIEITRKTPITGGNEKYWCTFKADTRTGKQLIQNKPQLSGQPSSLSEDELLDILSWLASNAYNSIAINDFYIWIENKRMPCETKHRIQVELTKPDISPLHSNTIKSTDTPPISNSENQATGVLTTNQQHQALNASVQAANLPVTDEAGGRSQSEPSQVADTLVAVRNELALLEKKVALLEGQLADRSSNSAGDLRAESLGLLQQLTIELRRLRPQQFEVSRETFLTFRSKNSDLIERVQYYQRYLREHALIIRTYAESLETVSRPFEASPRLSTGAISLLAAEIVGLLNSQASDEFSKAWNWLQVPYDPLEDLKFLGNTLKERVSTPAIAGFADLCGYAFVTPRVGDPFNAQGMRIAGEVTVAGIPRGVVAEVKEPGIRSLETQLIVHPPQVLIAT